MYKNHEKKMEITINFLNQLKQNGLCEKLDGYQVENLLRLIFEDDVEEKHILDSVEKTG